MAIFSQIFYFALKNVLDENVNSKNVLDENANSRNIAKRSALKKSTYATLDYLKSLPALPHAISSMSYRLNESLTRLRSSTVNKFFQLLCRTFLRLAKNR